jgi:type IV pilus assembly protein PilA
MTHQTMSNQSKNKSINNLARHQRFGASSLARMRHSKGFTLVELMVVIVIVGILSAVALPKFMGLKAKAKINTQIGEASGLAKECATAIIADGTYPEAYPKTDPDTTSTGLLISRSCTDSAVGVTDTTPPTLTDVIYTTEAVKGNEGAKCGLEELKANGDTCVVTVKIQNGEVTYTKG